MTRTELQQTALDLPPEERRALAEVLWESIETESSALSDWQKRLVDDRLHALATHPEEGSSWEEVEARIWPNDP